MDYADIRKFKGMSKTLMLGSLKVADEPVLGCTLILTAPFAVPALASSSFPVSIIHCPL